MLGAYSIVRRTAALLACALAVAFVPRGSAQTINLSLNVFYTNQSNPNSGGTWELVAKSSDFGIAGLRTYLTNINTVSPSLEQKAPRGTYTNGLAGFGIFDDQFHSGTFPQPDYHEFIFGQIPQDDGTAQGAFYGVGTLNNGSPGTIGPPIPSLTNPHDIPWATGDSFGDPVWSTAARFASGTFPAGVTPAFMPGSAGNVFVLGEGQTFPGDGDTFGTNVQASIGSGRTTIRTNFAQSADYNHNLQVDAPDYVMWRKTFNATVPKGTGADGYVDGTINNLDYYWWRSHFSTAPSSAASLSAGAVPEPGAGALLFITATLALAPLCRRRHGMLNNRSHPKITR